MNIAFHDKRSIGSLEYSVETCGKLPRTNGHVRLFFLVPHTNFSTMAAIAAQRVMLAEKWEENIDPTGWWMAEKLDGVRAYWSGSGFYSRQGNHFSGVPDFWKK